MITVVLWTGLAITSFVALVSGVVFVALLAGLVRRLTRGG